MEAKMCELVFTSGKVVSSDDFISGDGIHVECYTIELDGEEYVVTKNDGEWVYFHHTIR